MDKVSVVMATYNGEAHIIRQLESLRDQTRVPDEILIFDDQSTDNTIQIIQNFINENKLKTWHLQINRNRLGWKKNFVEGMKKASGDLVFLCDQDDVWYKEKIAKMTEGILADDHIKLLACDYNVIYEPGAIKAKIYKKTHTESNGLISRYEFKTNFFMNPNPGCSYVIRRSLIDQVINLWFPEAPHDEFLWLMATIQDGAFFYNEPLMDFVRYAGNNSEIRYKDIDLQLENLEYIGQMLQKLKEVANQNNPNDKVKLTHINNAIIWCEKRKHLMKSRNPVNWFLMVRYWGYYNSMKNCLSDLYLVLFGSFRRKK